MTMRALGIAIAVAGCTGRAPPAPVAPSNAPRATAPEPVVADDGTTVGTAHAIVVEAAAFDGAWIAICQARVDTDGDGAIEVKLGMHGDTWGDALTPFVVRRSGPGEPIDTLVTFSDDRRWLAVLRRGRLALLDGPAGAWTELAGADVRDDGVPLGAHRAASLGNRRMTYFRDDHTLVIRELASGRERAVAVPGLLWRVEVQPGDEWAMVYSITRDTDGDGKLAWPSLRTSLSARGCRGPITSYSTGGWSGDEPTEQWLELGTGALTTTAPTGLPPRPEPPESKALLGRPVIATDGDGRQLLGPTESYDRIPIGPLEWRK